MTTCPVCGSELEYIQKDNTYYCNQCRKHQQPESHETAQSPQPQAGTSKIPVMMAVIVVTILVLLAVVLLIPDPDEDKEKTVIMTFAEFNDARKYWLDHDGDFKDLEPGDTLVIKDEIYYIATDNQVDGWVTHIWFKSFHE